MLEQVKILQLQNVGFTRPVSAFIPQPPDPDNDRPEHSDWMQLLRSGIAVNVPFSVTVGKH